MALKIRITWLSNLLLVILFYFVRPYRNEFQYFSDHYPPPTTCRNIENSYFYFIGYDRHAMRTRSMSEPSATSMIPPTTLRETHFFYVNARCWYFYSSENRTCLRFFFRFENSCRVLTKHRWCVNSRDYDVRTRYLFRRLLGVPLVWIWLDLGWTWTVIALAYANACFCQFSCGQSLPANKQITKSQTHSSCIRLFTEKVIDRASSGYARNATNGNAWHGTLNSISVCKTHQRCECVHGRHVYSVADSIVAYGISVRADVAWKLVSSKTTKYKCRFFTLLLSFRYVSLSDCTCCSRAQRMQY